MKTMFLAAAAALVFSVGTAYADGGEGPIPNTEFTELPNEIAQAPVQVNHAYATNQNGSTSTSTYATQQYPWLPRG